MLIILLLGVGFFSGVSAGLLGVGGGLIFVPFAKFFFLDYLQYPGSFLKVIIATSTAIIVFNSLGAVIHHHRKKNINFELLPYFVVATLIGARIGVFCVDYVPITVLKCILAAFLIVSAVRILRGRDPSKDHRVLQRRDHIKIGGISIGISTLSSMLGLGGGAIMLPILNTGFHQPIKASVGTASIFTFAVSSSACLYYFWQPTVSSPAQHVMIGYVDIQIAAWVILGGILGSWVGVHLLHKTPVKKVQKIFAILLLFAAVKLML